MGKKATYPVRTTEKSLQILEELSAQKSARVTELAESLNMAKSTVHNHLSTLVEHEYIVKTGDKYTLSLKCLELGGLTRSRIKLYSIAVAQIQALRPEQRVGLHVEEYNKSTLVYLSEGFFEQGTAFVGMRTPLTESPSGRAILAHLPENRIESVLADVEESTTEETLRSQLETIRDRGYAVGQSTTDQLEFVALPIKDQEARVLGSFSLIEPDGAPRLNVRESVERLEKLAQRVERQIEDTGYDPDLFITPKHLWFTERDTEKNRHD